MPAIPLWLIRFILGDLLMRGGMKAGQWAFGAAAKDAAGKAIAGTAGKIVPDLVGRTAAKIGGNVVGQAVTGALQRGAAYAPRTLGRVLPQSTESIVRNVAGFAGGTGALIGGFGLADKLIPERTPDATMEMDQLQQFTQNEELRTAIAQVMRGGLI